ncbi:MAG: Sua5/YciO/YrdC/YwlC family protein [Planctomycetota bacterium]
MIFDLRKTDDPRDMVHRTVQALAEGRVVGVPSETVYGLIASALSESAVQALVALITGNGQQSLQPGQVSLCLKSGETAADFLVPNTPVGQRLSARCFPGPLTLIAPADGMTSATQQLPNLVTEVLHRAAQAEPSVPCVPPLREPKGLEAVTRQTHVAVRVADHRLLDHIHTYLAAPLIWGEVRVGRDESGEEIPATTAEKLQDAIRQAGDSTNDSAEETMPLLLDDGPTRYGGVPTVVRVDGQRWTMSQEGVIQYAAMKQFSKPVIVLVCTGNTCRSPMAETLLREILRERFEDENIARVVSAGLAASQGYGASPQAVEVMGRRGLDLTGHCSQPLDDSLMNMADLVLTMTRRHRDAILAAWPDRADRVHTLRHDGADISDPIGLPVETYEQCADQMQTELNAWMDQLGDSFFRDGTADADV